MIKPIRATGLERLELQRLRDRVGRLHAALQEATEAENPLASGTFAPPVDLCETEQAICIRIELPGVTADQIKIGITNDKLRIWGEKKRRPNRRRIISYLCSERSFGKFGRVVPLRWTVCIRTATAELANGMLYIRLPKTTSAYLCVLCVSAVNRVTSPQRRRGRRDTQRRKTLWR